jgi:3-oxoacyl-[acyl-carrier-protein] synthase III
MSLPNRSGMGVTFAGCGCAVPKTIVSNDALAQVVDTSDEWIASRTGIRQRHIVDESESLTSLATAAAKSALEMAKIDPQEIDLIILATSSAEDLFGTAATIQAGLGAVNAVAFDLTAACSGFVFGVVTAAQYLRSGAYQKAIVIGGDILSRWVDWSDRATCVLFGDGAGAVVMTANEISDSLLAFQLKSDGTQNGCLNLKYRSTPTELLPGVMLTQGQYQYITMNGKEVYRFAVNQIPDTIDKLLYQANLPVTDLNWLILHQANQRIMDAVADRLSLPADKVISNVADCGNTSAASIPIALDGAVRSGKIQAGDAIATAGFGAGLSWGAAIFRWQ